MSGDNNEAQNLASNSTTTFVEIPPTLSVHIPRIADINPTTQDWQDAPIPTQVVLLTVKNEEFLGCYACLKNVTKSFHDDLSWVYFGELGNKDKDNVQVCLVRCFQGSVTPGAASTTVQNAVRELNPKVVVCAGYCGGLNLQKVKLGDVVLSAKLATYSYSKMTSSGVEVRATIANISKRMRNLIMCAEHGWKAPFESNLATRMPQVYCMAEIASGPQLVVDPKRREELLHLFPEAIAIEMEGEGVYSACHDLGVEWAVIKGVSDYADDTKSQTSNWKLFASVMAASIVNHIFSDPVVLRTLPHYKETKSTQNQATAQPGMVPHNNPGTTGQDNPLADLLQHILVGDSGEMNYKGRTIGYSAQGRVHSLKELWVYDGEAWDVQTGIKFSKKHFKRSQDAIKFAINGLVEKLKNEGILKD